MVRIYPHGCAITPLYGIMHTKPKCISPCHEYQTATKCCATLAKNEQVVSRCQC